MKDLGVDDSVILKYMNRMTSTELIFFQDRGKWHALVKEVLYLQVEDLALLGY